ncbi:MAG: glycosyltransferase [Thermodesulfobacteriota bacterium]
MNDLYSPEISVVIVIPDNLATIRNTIECLRTQTAKDRMEVVIVAPPADRLNLNNSVLNDFPRTKAVELGNIESVAWGNAAGVRQATAPVVVLAEYHSYPDPTWAEALIKSHRQPCAAVGPVVRNANPNSAISWADLLIGYGPWVDHTPAGVVSHLPEHNCSYKREILLEYGDKLESMLEAESALHWDLCSRGFQIYLAPSAKISHTNFSLLSSWIHVQFLAGRVFAETRSKNWSLIKRLIYLTGSPLIPIIRFCRTLLEMYKPGRLQNMRFSMKICIFMALILGLILDGIGQFTGYALGAGDSKEKLSKYEFHRYRHISL